MVDLGVKVYVVYSLSEEDQVLYNEMKNEGLLSGGALFADMNDENTAADNVMNAVLARFAVKPFFSSPQLTFLHNSGVKFHGIYSPHEHAQTLVGQLSERLELLNNPTQAYINARNKRRCRDICSSLKIAVPRYTHVNERSDLDAAVAIVGLPLVLKPSSGAASAGVYKCSTLEAHRF